MAMGKRKDVEQPLFFTAAGLAHSPAHPFYRALNRLLDEHSFDRFVQRRCEQFYHQTLGRPSLPPGVYFRCLLIGYFEGIDSERGIAWRSADSLSLRSFLSLPLDENPPDHSTISRTRRLIDLETHHEVFVFVLELLAENDLIDGKTIGVDATTLEANAALRSIVRRDTGESYQQFLTRLAQASGIETPTREDLARLDRDRKNKGSNDDWQHPHDPDAKITKMKDGRTHLAHKAEHAVDMKTGAIVGVTLQGADQGDTTTIMATVVEATSTLRELSDDQATQEKINDKWMSEVVTDKGYHSSQTLLDLSEMNLRSYASEPDRGRRNWKDKPDEKHAVYANRRRCRGRRGRRLMRRRGELIERSFAHAYETGAMRRTHLRRHHNILKRLLVHTAGFNLALSMRKLHGVGKPRRLQGLFLLIWSWIGTILIGVGLRRRDSDESEINFAPHPGLALAA
ncbi:MAG TPA: transposase [Gemmatimonadaceae bacterium]|nr:transposase [Gemmatimonadaceae bacterium]